MEPSPTPPRNGGRKRTTKQTQKRLTRRDEAVELFYAVLLGYEVRNISSTKQFPTLAGTIGRKNLLYSFI